MGGGGEGCHPVSQNPFSTLPLGQRKWLSVCQASISENKNYDSIICSTIQLYRDDLLVIFPNQSKVGL